MPISDSGACRSPIPAYADHYFRAMPINKGTTLDNPKHVGHSLPKRGGRDVARKVIHRSVFCAGRRKLARTPSG
jgi:hypothetical protein